MSLELQKVSCHETSHFVAVVCHLPYRLHLAIRLFRRVTWLPLMSAEAASAIRKCFKIVASMSRCMSAMASLLV